MSGVDKSGLNNNQRQPSHVVASLSGTRDGAEGRAEHRRDPTMMALHHIAIERIMDELEVAQGIQIVYAVENADAQQWPLQPPFDINYIFVPAAAAASNKPTINSSIPTTDGQQSSSYHQLHGYSLDTALQLAADAHPTAVEMFYSPLRLRMNERFARIVERVRRELIDEPTQAIQLLASYRELTGDTVRRYVLETAGEAKVTLKQSLKVVRSIVTFLWMVRMNDRMTFLESPTSSGRVTTMPDPIEFNLMKMLDDLRAYDWRVEPHERIIERDEWYEALGDFVAFVRLGPRADVPMPRMSWLDELIENVLRKRELADASYFPAEERSEEASKALERLEKYTMIYL